MLTKHSFQENIPVITIDGPSGTGKGTLCYRLAKHLGWHALDSGAIYRVLALAATKRRIAFDDISQLTTLALQLNLKFDYVNTPCVLLDDIDVTSFIRSEECGQNASRIASIPEIRQALLERQRAFAVLPGLVTDGRDMGTVVFPKAQLKIYLDASTEERAKRRFLELQQKGIDVSLPIVLEELHQRDQRDSQRQASPLVAAEDAIHVDTTGLTIAQVWDSVLQLLRDKKGGDRLS